MSTAEVDATAKAASGAGEPALIVDGLTTSIRIDRQWFDAVRDVSFAVHPRETLASSASPAAARAVTALSIMGLLPAGVGRIVAAASRFDGVDLTAASAATAQAMRGDRIAMIFQEPMTSLNPVLHVGYQIAEVARAASRHERARRRAGARSSCWSW